MSESHYEFEIWRSDGKGGGRYSRYKVPKHEVSTVLEGIIWVIENLDPTVTARYACRMEICGSCSMEINGKPRMACSTIVDELGTDRIRIDPMKHYEVVKDLVVDIEPLFDKYREAKPYIIREEEDYSHELKQTPEEFKLYEQFSMCIKCGLCMAACPIVGSNPDYLGPAPLTAILRYNLDSRDEGKKYRIELADTEDGTVRCHFAGECTEVCPKDVDPSFAIQKLRWEGVKEKFKGIFRRSD